MRALCLLRPQPEYRRDAFVAGLASVGYRVSLQPAFTPGPGDVLVIWNRYGDSHKWAQRFEAAGGIVIVAENGYLGREWRGGRWYALSVGAHNGAGCWALGGADRWDGWQVPLAPWRREGGHVLVLQQRGIGTAPVAQPVGWAERVAQQLATLTRRPVRIRRHPGERPAETPLAADLAGAWACVTWASGSGLKALLAGVPVFHGLPSWIGAAAAERWPADIEAPNCGERLPMLRRLAWAMWELEEIAHGDAFRLLLPAARQGQGAPYL